MKKKDHLPDFRQLCPPEQKHTASLLSRQIFYFFLCAIAGFLWEITLVFVTKNDFANRGFLYGPWLPVYGAGAVLFSLLLERIKKHPIAVFILSVLIGSALELLIGWFLDTFWDLRYWDYRDSLINYRGYVCLWSAIGFGIAGVLWICLLSGFLTDLWLKLPPGLRHGINTILILLFMLDCAAALILPNMGDNITFSARVSRAPLFSLSSRGT